MTLGGQRYLVTGALGCIGAWTVAALVRSGADVVAFDRSTDRRRLQLVLGAAADGEDGVNDVEIVEGDLADLGTVESVVRSRRIAAIIHLGALQVPFCRADPPHGALVNVVGTVNVFEAARRCGLASLVYTSSIAVFDAGSLVGGRLPAGAPTAPATHYGVYKQANEGTARVYATESGVGSIGLRPMTVYGLGRDQGLTSSPTKAIVAAVLGCRYDITFGGSTLYQFAPDVAGALLAAARTPANGAQVINLDGSRADMATVVGAIEKAVPGAAGLLTFRPEPLPFPDQIDTTGLAAIEPPPVTPFVEAVAETAARLQSLREAGRLVPEDHGLVVRGDRATDRP